MPNEGASVKGHFRHGSCQDRLGCWIMDVARSAKDRRCPIGTGSVERQGMLCKLVKLCESICDTTVRT
jgi:hypothetical protein